MTILSIRSQDFEISRRVEEFQNVVSTITKVDFVTDDRKSFTSETSIGALQNMIVGYGRHSASTVIRTVSHAAETDDNVMFHAPLSGSSSIEQRGGEYTELKPGLVYADLGAICGRCSRPRALRSAISSPHGVWRSPTGCSPILAMPRAVSPVLPWPLGSATYPGSTSAFAEPMG